MRDQFASLLKDVSHDVEVEPQLQNLTGETLNSSTNASDEANLDVSARGCWQRGQRAFFDVRVFNPFENSHLTRLSRATKTKKRHYFKELFKSSMAP